MTASTTSRCVSNGSTRHQMSYALGTEMAVALGKAIADVRLSVRVATSITSIRFEVAVMIKGV